METEVQTVDSDGLPNRRGDVRGPQHQGSRIARILRNLGWQQTPLLRLLVRDVLFLSSHASNVYSRRRICMKRLHYALAFAAALAVPCASSQTWELGKDGTVTQTQTANS